MKEQVLNLFKQALKDYQNEIKKGMFGERKGKYEEGLCFFFRMTINPPVFMLTDEKPIYEVIVEIIDNYKPKKLVRELFHFFPGELAPRIELLKKIITDIEAGKHDDILLKKEVES
jgi:hypothetical protein